MTVSKWRDWQELCNGLHRYYDLSSRGINGTNVINLITPGTNDGTLVGSGFTYTSPDRFGSLKNTNVNWSSNNFVTTSMLFNYQNGAVAAWIKYTPSSDRECIIGHYDSSSNGRGMNIVENTCVLYDELYASGTGYPHASTYPVPPNEWCLLVLTWGTLYQRNLFIFTMDDIVEHKNYNSTAYASSETHVSYIGISHDHRATNGYSECNHTYITEVFIWKDRQLSKADVIMLWNITRYKYLYPITPGVRGVL